MTPDVEQFLDLATRPLEATPGEREEAKGELMSRIAHAGVPYEMLDLAEPLERLQKAKPAKHGLRRAALIAGALLITGGAAVASRTLAHELLMMSQAGMMSVQIRFGGFGSEAVPPEPLLHHVRSRAPGLPLGLHPQAGAAEETASALQKNPDDLPMWQEHVTRQVRESSWSGLAQEESDAIARLDADNALWPLIQVTPHMEKVKQTSTFSLPGGVAIMEPEFQSALQRFSEAAAKSVYRDHSRALKRRQLDAFPPDQSLSDSVVSTGFADLASSPTGTISDGFESLAKTHCERLVAAGDKAGLLKFFEEWKLVLHLILRSEAPGALDYSGVLSQVTRMETTISGAFVELGMTAEAGEAEHLVKGISNVIYSGGSGAIPPELEGVAGARIDAESLIPLGLTAEELRPSRSAELCYFDRILGTILVVLSLVFTGLVALETCRRSKVVKAMARGLTPLLHPRDQWWIGGLGLALPWLWWWAIVRMSPLGMRDAKFEEWTALVWLLQPVAGVAFGMVMLLQATRWRWGVRGGFIGLGVSLPWTGWGAAALTGSAIPSAGAIRYLPLNDDETAAWLLGVAGMAACGVLWFLWQGIMNLFTPRSGALRPNLTMRAALPWAIAGVATLLASVAVVTAMERYWFAKDPLFPSWTSKTHINAIEERADREIQEALRGL
ncbi:hypothetical protein OKA05_18235 [Luteolibacter arcticus]|uniref:Uncharacterized protein n=1 Tax=Luteolibacter arcticus TaxID=1581411 RepID=A0ABT3GLW3_9BACT|nr:hypothetical protein [Luteolibacter arcticus]MCW1924510.1 hypothetical protein [Luteolibacter arcticus]